MSAQIDILDASLRDDLTGLASLDAASLQIADWQKEAASHGETARLHAMLLGIGRFDAVNLAYGEAAGDGALVNVAQRMSHFAEDEFDEGQWFAARIGGGKFLLCSLGQCSRERWQWLAEALADAISHPMANPDGAGSLRLWPRIALMRPGPGEGTTMILDRLAETLEEAGKHKARHVLWSDRGLTVPGRRSAEVEADLLAALDRDQIEIVYQPQFALKDDRMIGAEALARWQHPELGRIGASQLFAIAERVDHVAQLSRLIAGRALADAVHWDKELKLSINVTPADLASQSFARGLIALVTDSGFDPSRVMLEITEHVLLADLERSAETLKELRDYGMRIALDDFGAGFCNFRYLKMLPLDAIKLDKAMIEGLDEDPRDLAVLRGLMAMAKALGLEVIAEGVETEKQRAIIAEEGGMLYQGFLRAQPMFQEDFLRFSNEY